MKSIKSIIRVIYILAIYSLIPMNDSFANENLNKEREQIMNNLTIKSKIGDIVAQRCSSSRIFENYKIDYCCGGKSSLEEVCNEIGLDPEAVLAELKDHINKQVDEKSWNNEPLSALIDHIQTTHHKFLWEELPKLEMLVEKVARVHGENHPELLIVRDIYTKLKVELEEHLAKEENEIFPSIKKIEAKQADPNQLQEILTELEKEHDDAGEAFHRLRELTNDFTPPENSCNSYRALFTRLNELESDMHRHVHKENSILIPRALLFKKG